MKEFWDKSKIYRLQSLIYDVGGFMTACGDIWITGCEKDVLQIRVCKPNQEFTESLALEVLKNMLYEEVPLKKVNFIY